MLVIKESIGKGRGVYAQSSIEAGECIERSPVIVIPEDEIIHIRRSVFQHYYFKWGKELKDGALALGLGSLFNHSYQPNARYMLNVDELIIEFRTLRAIHQGEEITINYDGDPDDLSKLWFKPLE